MSRSQVVSVVKVFVLASSLSGLSALVGCGGHPWHVLHEAPPPSPLKGAGPVTVSFDYSHLIIDAKNEEQWVQAKTAEDPQYPKKWADLKGSLETHFTMGLAERWPKGAQLGPADAPGVHVLVKPTTMRMGHYIVIGSTPTVVTIDVLYTVDGKDAEEISTNAERFASIIEPSVFQHIPQVAATLGRYNAKFLASKN